MSQNTLQKFFFIVLMAKVWWLLMVFVVETIGFSVMFLLLLGFFSTENTFWDGSVCCLISNLFQNIVFSFSNKKDSAG